MKKRTEIDMSEEAVTRRLEEIRALYKLMKSFRECRDALPKDQRLG
ncbi:hypothetical protein BH11MYX1_BH11MYX1_26070 [soil metagenome]